MSIIIECPGCGTRFRCKYRLAGKRVSCLVCQQQMHVPRRSIHGQQIDPDISAELDSPADAIREAPWITPHWSTDSATSLMTQSSSSTSRKLRVVPTRENRQYQTCWSRSAPHPVSLFWPLLFLIALVSSGIWLVLFLFCF
ncbi:hypothetical protein [Gimesia sp.]|uniref:hypothetical protein n=1 Tax=Gimesia sp. TaxID=2024833 RepID=UPI003A90AB19